MTQPARLRQTLNAGGTVFGLWATIPSSLPPEIGAAVGYDYICIDEQHGVVDTGQLTAMLQAGQAGGGAPLVRVAQNEPWLVMRALDLGALGVIVPMVNDGQEAARAVAACRYPPHGERSFGPIRAHLAVGSSRTGDLGSEPLCFAMIETRAGLDRLEEIAETPGLDGIYVGPSDLALALGLEPSPRLEHPDLLDAIERVRGACEVRGLIPGLHCLGGADAARFAGQGFRLLTVGVDLLFLRAAMTQELAQARELPSHDSVPMSEPTRAGYA